MKVKAITEFLYEGKHIDINGVFDAKQDDAVNLIRLGRVISIDGFEEPTGGLTTETAGDVVKGKKAKKADDAE